MTTDKENPDVFSHLIGEQLSAVTFVMDYLQLQFDGYLLSVINPLMVTDKYSYRLGDAGYRDAICNRIARKVTNTVLAEDYLSIVFEDNSSFQVSLKKEDYVGAEAINFHFPEADNKSLIVI